MPTPTISLKAVNVNPVQFTPSVYEYKPQDFTLLKDSLSKREARMKDAVQQRTAFYTSIGKLKDQMHVSEQSFLEDYARNKEKEIQDNILSGDPGAASRLAISFAGDIFKDPQILGRIEANNQYKKFEEEVKTKHNNDKIGQDTVDWALANNPYNYIDPITDDGVITKGTWTPNFTPTDDMDWSKTAATAASIIRPDKKANQWQLGGADALSDKAKSKLNVAPSKDYNLSYDEAGGYSFEQVTYKEIEDNIEQILGSIPDGFRKAQQAYDVAKWKFKQLEDEMKSLPDGSDRKKELLQQLDQMCEVLGKHPYNGTMDFVDYKTYSANRIAAFSGSLAYKSISTSSAIGANRFNKPGTKTHENGSSDDDENGQHTPEEGSPVDLGSQAIDKMSKSSEEAIKQNGKAVVSIFEQ